MNLNNNKKSGRSQAQKTTYLYDPIYVKCPERANYRDRKQILGGWWLGMGASDRKGMMGTFLMWWKCVGLW